MLGRSHEAMVRGDDNSGEASGESSRICAEAWRRAVGHRKRAARVYIEVGDTANLEKAWGRCPAASPARGGKQVCESVEESAARELMVSSIFRHGHLKTLEV